jgi:hypothetical protein
MHFARSLALMCFAALATPLCFAATGFATEPEKPLPVSKPAGSALPDAPVAGGTEMGLGGQGWIPLDAPSFRPFSSVAIGVKVGAAGVGFDVATPLNRKLNLRGSASFFSYSPHVNQDGLNLIGTLNFKTVNASLDFYPMGGAFRISPGVTMYNGNHVNANAVVPGGQTLVLNGTTYYSSQTDPVNGTFNVAFGNKVAPSLSVGLGNMIPRRIGQHWSVPFEIGFEYINAPTIALNLAGSACTTNAMTYCQPVQSTPSVMANVKAQQAELNSDIRPLRFYPTLSIGFAYKFGR